MKTQEKRSIFSGGGGDMGDGEPSEEVKSVTKKNNDEQREWGTKSGNISEGII